MTRSLRLLLALTLVVGCGQADSASEEAPAAAADVQVAGPQDVVAQITGLSGPEAVRYDPEFDVYYVSNFNGDSGDRDANGFITRATATGDVTDLQFMVGTDDHPLHAPRGMNIEGGVLWVADNDGVHGFDRSTGAQVEFHDLSGFEPGFLNDIGVNGSGVLYVTDTGKPRVYAIEDGIATIAVEDPVLGPPNGITWDEQNGRFVLAPWAGVTEFASWTPGPDGGTLGSAGRIDAGYFDGIEPIRGGLLIASQADSTLYFMDEGRAVAWIRVAGDPADIGIDTRRMRVAVPYIGLDRVDIWDLPPNE